MPLVVFILYATISVTIWPILLLNSEQIVGLLKIDGFKWTANMKIHTFHVTCRSMVPRRIFAICSNNQPVQ